MAVRPYVHGCLANKNCVDCASASTHSRHATPQRAAGSNLTLHLAIAIEASSDRQLRVAATCSTGSLPCRSLMQTPLRLRAMVYSTQHARPLPHTHLQVEETAGDHPVSDICNGATTKLLIATVPITCNCASTRPCVFMWACESDVRTYHRHSHGTKIVDS
jgi:hypothetical protein